VVLLWRARTGSAQLVSSICSTSSPAIKCEVGFGPGVGIQLLTSSASAGYVAGVDPSKEMVAQAASRNKKSIESGQVDLRHGSVASLRFADNTFDKALAINSMQVWPDAVASLGEMRRVIKPGGKVALGFTPNSGQPNTGLAEMFTAAWFAKADVVERIRTTVRWRLNHDRQVP
jgi:ubiquinone/menaquinone biosynthesis C-methylase UbiE